jgi:hypothetical protein
MDGYTTAGGKLGNRSILSAVVGVNGLYLRLLATLESPRNDLKEPSKSVFRFIANIVTYRL